MCQGTSHFTIKEGTQVNIQGLVGLLSYSVGASKMPPLIVWFVLGVIAGQGFTLIYIIENQGQL